MNSKWKKKRRKNERGRGPVDRQRHRRRPRWPLFESAICIYSRPLFVETHGEEGGARRREGKREKNYSKTRRKGWGPLVVTGLYDVPVGKNSCTRLDRPSLEYIFVERKVEFLFLINNGRIVWKESSRKCKFRKLVILRNSSSIVWNFGVIRSKFLEIVNRFVNFRKFDLERKKREREREREG